MPYPNSMTEASSIKAAKLHSQKHPISNERLHAIFTKAAILIDEPDGRPVLCYTGAGRNPIGYGYEYKEAAPRLRTGAWDAIYHAFSDGTPWCYTPEFFSVQKFWDDLHRKGNPREQFSELFWCGDDPIGSPARESAKAAILYAAEVAMKKPLNRPWFARLFG